MLNKNKLIIIAVIITIVIVAIYLTSNPDLIGELGSSYMINEAPEPNFGVDFPGGT